jgi:dipeptidyl aminopeptidase/acylaminoacyl peptidase
MIKRLSVLALGSAMLAFLTGCSLSQPVPLIPRKLLFDHAERRNPQISPDGKLLAYLAPDNANVLQIWLQTLGSRDDKPLTAEKGHGVQHYTWSYNGHLIFGLDRNGDENWNIHTLDIHSGAVRNLTPYQGVRCFVVALNPNFPDDMLVAMNLRNRNFHDVYRINLKTGDTRMVHRNPGRQVWWVADRRFNIRVATSTAFVLTKDRVESRWRQLHKWQLGDPGGLIGFSQDEKTFYIFGSHDSDNGYLLALDVQNGEKKILAHDPDYDAYYAFIHPTTRAIQAVGFYKEKLEWKVLDETIAEDFATLANLRNGEFTVIHPFGSPILPSRNLGRRDLADKIWIVSYNNDDGPISHYAYERATKKATLLFSEQPKLEGLPLAKMQPISYNARDGLKIHGYLTLPVGVTPKHVPTVLLVTHGDTIRLSNGSQIGVMRFCS